MPLPETESPRAIEATTTEATPEGRWADAPAFVGVALWAGLAAGLVELALILSKAKATQDGLLRKSFDVIWMAPLADTLVLGLVGLGLAAVVRPLPKFGRRLAGFLLALAAMLVVLLAVPGLRGLACLALAGGLASWIAPAARTRAAGFRRLVRWSAPALVLIFLGLAGVALARDWRQLHGPAPTGVAPPGAPNVLLVVMDTVRADDTSLIDGGPDTTPNLAALAARGTRFERAIATAPWTLPSHASMFTGRWAGELDVGPDRPLDDTYPTLAEYLGARGYDTAGFVANVSFCTAEYGLSRGFARYEDYPLSAADFLRSTAIGWLLATKLGDLADRLGVALGREPGHPFEGPFTRKSAATIHRDALAWIDARAGDGRPFFAFLNDFDAHDPYLLPPGVEPASGRPPYTLAQRRVLRDWVTEVQRDRPAADFALARQAYDDCLAYLDDQVGRLVEGLERRGLLENTIVIITADHGEHFGEHRRNGLPLVGHRLTTYQQEIRVPLLILAPGRMPAGAVVRGSASLRDLPATIVDLAGLADGSPFPGESFAHTADGPGRPALAEFDPSTDVPPALRGTDADPGAMRAVVSDAASLQRLDGGREEAYDLTTDPAEQRDLSGTEQGEAILDRLRPELERLAPSP